MSQWRRYVQKIVDKIDLCIKARNDEALTHVHKLRSKYGSVSV